MATQTLNTRIALKSDTTANWAKSTLVLLKGEQAIEITESGAYKIKIGDGVKTFAELPYATMTPEEISALIGDGSVQNVTLASGTNNGTLKLTVDGTTTDNIAVKGLGSAAYTNTSAYATAAQGALATNAVRKVVSGTANGTISVTTGTGAATDIAVVTKVEGDKFYTIEGNTSGGSSIVPNGGGVYAKSYYNSNLPGTKFCRPDYSIVTSILTSNTSSTSSPAPVQPSYTAWVGSCTANGTDVFSGATGASKLSTYPKLNAGNLVDIIGESGTRYQVRIAAKYIGYVEKSNIKNPNTPAATTTKKYPFVGKVTASKLNVRKKPGTEHPLLPEYPMLNKDNLINVLGVTKDTKGDRWYKVSITKKEYVGYVSAKYIIKA